MRWGTQSDADVSRRKVLQTTGGLAAAGGLVAQGASPVSGSHDGAVTVNVGFEGDGRALAQDVASNVNRSFDFDAMNIDISEGEIGDLRRQRNIRYVELDGTMEAYADDTPWGIERTAADVAHSNGYGGDGADIAILDTGIDSDHQDLQANIGQGKAFTECGGNWTCWLFGNDNSCAESWDDDHNHGTHCAGIADAAKDDQGIVGVSHSATLHPVKVLDCQGSGDMSDVAAGLEWVADQGYDVASLSLGSSQESQVVSDAVEYAYEKGVLVVAAAGNDGECTDCVGWPAAHPKAIAVSATSSDDSMADFSSTGPEIDIAAPGEDIESTVAGGYDTFSGTSMACPHVSGAAGQLIAAGASRDQAEELLFATAEDIGHPETDQGHGLLQVWEALQELDGGDPGEGPTIAEFLVNEGADGIDIGGLVEGLEAGTITLSVEDEEGNGDTETRTV